jgi:hypothetical protein
MKAFGIVILGLMVAILAITILLFAFSAGREQMAKIPSVIIVFLCLIIGITYTLARMMFRQRSRVLDAYASFLGLFKNLCPLSAEERTLGLTNEKCAELRKRGRTLNDPVLKWWLLVEESLTLYRCGDGREGWFVLRPLPEILNEDVLVWSEYQGSYFQAIPGILTALGLLGTFIAILLGLSGVSYNPKDLIHPVSGIDSLINGLSGKFLTSICALILSILFTFAEKRICERIVLSEYSRLIAQSKEALPYLSQSRILLDLPTAVAKNLRQGQSYPGEVTSSKAS